MAFPGQFQGPGSVAKNVYGPAPTGRPAGRTTRPKPFFARVPNAAALPQTMQLARDLMKAHGNTELPPGLMPRWLLNKKNQNISKSMAKGS